MGIFQVSGPRNGGSARIVERLFENGSTIGLSETQLVDRFAAGRDEDAFAALVDRHGPMVLGVCRRLLRDPHDADDAFQAVFLVLARKAEGLRDKERLANWLFGVACRVASEARRRRPRTEPAIEPRGVAVVADPAEAFARREDEARLHEEVNRLPMRYRAPVVACYFEGKTHEEAASLLRCPVGTVKGRLARARDLLRRRLERRGVVAPAAVLATALASSPDLRAAVPAALAARTVAISLALSASPAAWMTAAALSTPARSLAQGVIQAMFYSQLKMLAIPTVLVGAALVAGGASLAASRPEGEAPKEDPPAPVQADDRAPADLPRNSQSASKPDDARPTERVPAQTTEIPPGRPAPSPQPASAINGGDGGGGFGGGGMDGPSPNQLRQDIAGLAAVIGKVDEDPASNAVREALDRPFTLRAGKNGRLSELLEEIKGVRLDEGKKLPVYVDPVGLEDAEKTLDSPVSIDLEDVPLRFSLRVALKQLGLAYCVRDGVLIISSIEGIQQELLEAEKEMVGLHPDKTIYGQDGPHLIGGPGGLRAMGGMGGGMR